MLTHAAERGAAARAAECRRGRERPCARRRGRGGTARTTGERVANERRCASNAFRPALGQHSTLCFFEGARWRDLAEQRRGGRAPPARATGRAGARRGTAGTLDPVGPPRALRGLSALAAGNPPPHTHLPPFRLGLRAGGEEGVGTQAGGQERALFCVDQRCGRWQRGVCACGCRAGRRASSWMRAGT